MRQAGYHPGVEARPVALVSSLRGARLLRGVDEAVLRELADAGSLARLLEGTHLWRAGQRAESFTIIVRGLVQIERRTASGEPAVVGIFGPRESVGDSAALARDDYPADAVAITDVEVVRLPAELVLARMARDPELGKAVQTALLDHTRALVAKIDIVSAGSVTARLATLLLHLYERFGDEDESGTSTVAIPISRTGLARLVSARPETVIRALSSLVKAQVLAPLADGFAIPDLDRLRALAREG
jgi:CRP-like cAMP-binding protein